MKKIYLLSTLILPGLAMSAFNPKFDAAGNIALSQYEAFKASPKAAIALSEELPIRLAADSRGEATATVYITLNNGVSASQIEDLGFETLAAIDDMMLINGPLEDIIALSETDLVKNAAFPGKAEPMLNVARERSNADAVLAGSGLPQAYTGKGVIAGIYDSGMDPNHVFFQTADGETRIKRLWHFSSTNGYSTEYATPERIASFTTDNRGGTHGTHTMGCLAGNMTRRGPKWINYDQATGTTQTSTIKSMPFYSAARDADIAAACGSLDFDNITAAVEKIRNFAKSSNQPAVINLSIGSVIGPHDGTDAATSMINKYAAEYPIFVSAGNEGDSRVSIVKTLTASDASVKTFPAANTPGSAYSGIIDIWGKDASAFDTKFVIYNTTTNSIEYQYSINAPGQATVTTSNYTAPEYIHDTKFDQAFSSSFVMVSASDNKQTNNRFNCQIQYSLRNNTLNKGTLILGIIVDGKAGQTIYLTNNSQSATLSGLQVAGWMNGTPDLSINNLACGNNIIAVGSWTTRTVWSLCNNQTYSYNESANLPYEEVSGFSSYGTLADGRSLPLFCAPGAGIISSISSYYAASAGITTNSCAYWNTNGKSYYWNLEQGTSMSSPFAAGCVAAWLEANPNLTPAEVRDVIVSTAAAGNGTDATSRQQWGAGKLDAYAGIKKVLDLSGVADITLGNDNSGILLRETSDGVWEVFAAGAKNISATVYNVSGQLATSVNASGDTAVIDCQNLGRGIYIISVNGIHNQKITVR